MAWVEEEIKELRQENAYFAEAMDKLIRRISALEDTLQVLEPVDPQDAADEDYFDPSGTSWSATRSKTWREALRSG